MRASMLIGLRTSQSLTGSSEAAPVVRCGAASHGVKPAPMATAWSRRVGSAMTRTS